MTEERNDWKKGMTGKDGLIGKMNDWNKGMNSVGNVYEGLID